MDEAKDLNPPTDSQDSDARSRLIAAAIKLFAERGLEGTTTREIAQAAQLNVSLISYYFGGKDGLYRSAILDFAEETKKHVDQFISTSPDAPLTREFFMQAMRRLVSYLIEIHLKKPNMKIILFRELISGMPHSRELFDEVFFVQITQVLRKFVESAQRAGIVRKELNPTAYLLMFVHTVDSHMMVLRCQTRCSADCFQLPEQKELFLDQVTSVLLEGGLS